MSRPQIQSGYVYESNSAFHCRFYAHENGKRRQRSVKLCAKDDIHPSKESYAVQSLAAELMSKVNAANSANDSQPGHNCPLCGGRCRRTIKGKFAKQDVIQ